MWERLPSTPSIQGTSSDFPHINSDTKTWSPQPKITALVFCAVQRVLSAEAMHQPES